MNRMILAVAVAVALSPIAAQAQTAGTTYISVAAGINKMQHERVHVHLDGSPAPSVSGELLTKTGPAFVVSIGKNLGSQWRTELGFDYRSDKIKGESGLQGETNGTGTETKYGVMANALYDFDAWGLHPYLGAGLGGQFVHEPTAHSSNGPVSVTVEGATHGSFAYQGIAGLAFPLQSASGMAITLEYRYLALTGTRNYHGTATVPGSGSFPLTDTSDSDQNHTLLLGLRF
ncbi:MAG: outer membrane beta-barrel protein [Acidobacteriota bacterium]